MKAWFLTGPNQFEMRDVPEPVLREGWLKVELLTVQPSITECIMVTCDGDAFGIGESVKAGKPFRLPGHELCGRVIETGPGSRFQVGDRVASLAKIRCGRCGPCLADGKCEREELLGVTIDGVFSERAVLPETGLAKVPDTLSDAEAANLQPLADCVAAVDSVDIRLGDTVAVYGAGCLGMNTMQVARASGASRLIVVDVKEENLALARKLGATHVINGRETDPVAAIKEITGGIGADVVFDAAGGDPRKGLAGTVALVNAAKSVRHGGQLLILAFYGDSVEFPIGDLRPFSKKLVMPRFTTVKHMAHGGRLIASGLVQIEPLVTVRLQGLDQVAKAFEITANKAGVKSIAPAQVIVKD